MGPEAALCNGVYGSEGNRSSALLAREVCSFNIVCVCVCICMCVCVCVLLSIACVNVHLNYTMDVWHVFYFPWFRRQIWVISWTPASPPSRAPASMRPRTWRWSCWTSAGRWLSSWKAQQSPVCQGGLKFYQFFFILVSSSACQARPRVALAGNLWRKPDRSSSSDVWTPRRQVKLFTSLSILFPIFNIFRHIFPHIPSHFSHILSYFSSGEAPGRAQHSVEKLQESFWQL